MELDLRFFAVKKLFLGAFICILNSSPLKAENRDLAKYAIVGQTTLQLLQARHIQHIEVGDELSKKHLASYLHSIDPTHLIFLSSDIEVLNQTWATKLDDELRNGSIQAIEEIRSLYLRRLQETLDSQKQIFFENYDLLSKRQVQRPGPKTPWPKDPEERKERLRLYFARSLQDGLATKKSLEDVQKDALKKAESDWAMANLFPTSAQYSQFINALLENIDPHTRYLTSHESIFIRNLSDTYQEGSLGFVFLYQGDRITIDYIVPHGAAERGGLRQGDRVLAIASKGHDEFISALNLDIDQFSSLLRGHAETPLQLRIERKEGGQLLKLTLYLVREPPKRRAADAFLIEHQNKKIGIIRIPDFYDDQSSKFSEPARLALDVQKLLYRLMLRKVDGLILDLRFNQGGELTEASNLLALFTQGLSLQTLDSQGDLNRYWINSHPPYRGPLMVLVNAISASASEVVAGTLQEKRRALIVGAERTMGKATGQKAYDFERQGLSDRDLGILLVTALKLYKPSGQSAQKLGIRPDIVIPSRTLLIDSEADLLACLEPDSLKRTSVLLNDYVTKHLQTLRSKSVERVTSQPVFTLVNEDILESQEKRKQTYDLIDLDAYSKQIQAQKEMSLKRKFQIDRVPEPQILKGLRLLADGNEETNSKEFYASNIPDNFPRNSVIAPTAKELALELNESVQILIDFIDLSKNDL